MELKAVVTDYSFPNLAEESRILAPLGFKLVTGQCKTTAEVIALCHDADAILNQFAPIDRAVIASLKKCKMIVRYGIGVDNVDVQAASEANILVVNIPDYGIQEVADHTISLMLALIRKIPQIDQQVRNGIWENAPFKPTMGLKDKQIGLLGFGNIAREVAKRAQSFNMNVSAFDPYQEDRLFQEAGVTRKSSDDLLMESDVVCVHLPLNEDTQYFIRTETLALMKESSYLINTSRGGVVDTMALVAALTAGKIAGAALDVLEEEPIPSGHPILQAPHCLLTSHVAWYSEDSLFRLQQFAAMEIYRFFTQSSPKHIVNAKEVRIQF